MWKVVRYTKCSTPKISNKCEMRCIQNIKKTTDAIIVARGVHSTIGLSAEYQPSIRLRPVKNSQTLRNKVGFFFHVRIGSSWTRIFFSINCQISKSFLRFWKFTLKSKPSFFTTLQVKSSLKLFNIRSYKFWNPRTLNKVNSSQKLILTSEPLFYYTRSLNSFNIIQKGYWLLIIV